MSHSPSTGSSQLNPGTLSEIWAHRDLLWQFTVRNLEMRHKGSILGILWTVGSPLLSLTVYVTVFGFIFGGHFVEDPIGSNGSYAISIFLGLTIFHFIAEIVALTPSVILSSPNLVKKVRFPLAILPAATVVSSFVHFLVALSLCGISAHIVGISIWHNIAWLIILLPPIALTALGIALINSAVGVFIRDINQLTPTLTMILLYSSAIFFSIHKIPTAIWQFLRWNPLLHMVSESRNVLLWDIPLNLVHLAYIYTCGFALLTIGAWLFRTLRPNFADAI